MCMNKNGLIGMRFQYGNNLINLCEVSIFNLTLAYEGIGIGNVLDKKI